MPKPRTSKPAAAVKTPRKRISKDVVFDYKLVDVLSRFITPQGYIVGRDKTGLSQKQQRQLTQAVKRARHLALLPFTQTL